MNTPRKIGVIGVLGNWTGRLRYGKGKKLKVAGMCGGEHDKSSGL